MSTEKKETPEYSDRLRKLIKVYAIIVYFLFGTGLFVAVLAAADPESTLSFDFSMLFAIFMICLLFVSTIGMHAKKNFVCAVISVVSAVALEVQLIAAVVIPGCIFWLAIAVLGIYLVIQMKKERDLFSALTSFESGRSSRFYVTESENTPKADINENASPLAEKKPDVKNDNSDKPAAPVKQETGQQTEKSFKKLNLDSLKRFDQSGVCDVCNKPISPGEAYCVDNYTFYHSPEYREHSKRSPLAIMTGVAGEMNDSYFERLYAQDRSPGSAVCPDCIHMFAEK